LGAAVLSSARAAEEAMAAKAARAMRDLAFMMDLSVDDSVGCRLRCCHDFNFNRDVNVGAAF
jgi:hypothetical protein